MRQVDLDALSPVARKVFQYAFPVFDETPTLTPWNRAAFERGEKVERPYNYRRFAGGAELPRGCYATLCMNGSRDDGGTLAGELTSYAEPRKSGELYVFEGHDLGVPGCDTDRFGQFPGYRPAPGSIVVAFVSRPDAPHPLLVPEADPLGDRHVCETFRRSAPQNERGVILLEVPTRVGRVRHEGVFDLRRPSNQELLNKWAREGLFRTIFLYLEPFDGPARVDIKSIIPEGYPWVMFYWPPTGPSVRHLPPNAMYSTSLRADDTDDGTFRQLFLFLVSPMRGGSPITEAIGATIRTGGARGLIYPSARTDVLSRYHDDELIEHNGWCFVDYSAFEVARPTYRIIVNPKLWIGADVLSFGIPPAGSPEVGSLEVLGLTARTLRKHAKLVDAWYDSERIKVMRLLGKRWWQFWVR